jgi:hypothetical protein
MDPFQWVPGVLFLGIKRPGREADHSPTSTAQVKEWLELYLHSPNTPSWSGAQLKEKAHRQLYVYLYLTSLISPVLETRTYIKVRGVIVSNSATYSRDPSLQSWSEVCRGIPQPLQSDSQLVHHSFSYSKLYNLWSWPSVIKLRNRTNRRTWGKPGADLYCFAALRALVARTWGRRFENRSSRHDCAFLFNLGR